jgi:hypothetical protein
MHLLARSATGASKTRVKVGKFQPMRRTMPIDVVRRMAVAPALDTQPIRPSPVKRRKGRHQERHHDTST